MTKAVSCSGSAKNTTPWTSPTTSAGPTNHVTAPGNDPDWNHLPVNPPGCHRHPSQPVDRVSRQRTPPSATDPNCVWVCDQCYARIVHILTKFWRNLHPKRRPLSPGGDKSFCVGNKPPRTSRVFDEFSRPQPVPRKFDQCALPRSPQQPTAPKNH